MEEEKLKFVLLAGGGLLAVLAAVGAVTYMTCQGPGRENLNENKIYHQNVLRNEKPETYVEVNGVKYFSHIDGKDLSDLVKK